jgi:hypothetical protein
VTISANGNENALGFSLNFDPSKLTFVDAIPGAGAANGQVLISPGQLTAGKLGLAIGLPSGEVLAAGTQEVARIVFRTAAATVSTTTPITFGDQPVTRQISDSKAVAVPGTYAGGTLSYPASQFEADTAPRPDGDASVSITDWVQAGRYVARLDYPTNASEFQRADCAPRSTKGDGLITVNDWVQAGRYAAVIDSWELASGPTSEPPPSPVPQRGALGGPIQYGSEARYLKVTDGIILDNQTGQVSVQLSSQGDESALSFSVSFDPAVVVFVSAEKGSGVGTATFNPNTADAAKGKLGFAIAQMNKNFAPGLTDLVRLTFRAGSSASTNTVVSLSDQPVPRGVSDTNALGLPAEYIPGTISVNPTPVLTVSVTNEMVTIAWPQWATNYALQEAEKSILLEAGAWRSLSVNPDVVNGELTISVSASNSTSFYRLKRP